jgi:hypothetical protein
MPAKLSIREKQVAVDVVLKMMEGLELNNAHVRLKNFIKLSYNVDYSLPQCAKLMRDYNQYYKRAKGRGIYGRMPVLNLGATKNSCVVLNVLARELLTQDDETHVEIYNVDGKICLKPVKLRGLGVFKISHLDSARTTIGIRRLVISQIGEGHKFMKLVWNDEKGWAVLEDVK